MIYSCNKLFAQGWDTCDKRIRQITDRVFYVYKGVFTGKWFSKYWRIPYDILFPDPKKGNEGLGQIIQGYKKPSVIARILSKKCFRPKYYKYFDSWLAPVLPALPDNRIHRSVPLFNNTNPAGTVENGDNVDIGAVVAKRGSAV